MSSSYDELKAETRYWRALAVSILVHAAILAVPMRDRIGEQIMQGDNKPPLSVQIVQLPKPPTPEATPPPPPPSPSPAPTPQPQPPRMMTRRPSPDTKAPQVPVPPPVPTPTPVPERAPPEIDMAALLEERRAQRRAYEQQALAAATQRDQGPQLADSSSSAAIKRNLGSLAHGSEGTSGVFQILRKGERTAEFAFNGWKPDAGSRRWREVIEVDAGPGGDVEMAIIRRMIQLIRTHYTGDFNWQSYRIGKTITLSARVEDTEALEDFMSREFFGVPVLKKLR